MCGPAAIGPALLISGVMMGGMQAYSAFQQGAMADAQAADRAVEAQDARRIGQINERQSRTDMARALARQRAALNAAGVNIGDASALDLGADAGEQAFLEAQAVRTQASARADALDFESQLSRATASQLRLSGIATGAGTAFRAGAAAIPSLAPGGFGTSSIPSGLRA